MEYIRDFQLQPTPFNSFRVYLKPLLFETNNRIIPQQVTQGALNTRSNRVILLPNDQSTPNPARANENQQYSLNQFMLGSRGRGYSLPPSVGSSSITSLFEPLPDRNGLSRPRKKEGLGAAHKQFAPSSANDFECYLLPSQICPGPSPFVIRGFLSFIATGFARTEVETRLVPFFFSSPFSFFFPLRADTLEIDDRRESRGYSWKGTGFLI